MKIKLLKRLRRKAKRELKIEFVNDTTYIIYYCNEYGQDCYYKPYLDHFDIQEYHVIKYETIDITIENYIKACRRFINNCVSDMVYDRLMTQTRNNIKRMSKEVKLGVDRAI